MPSGLLYSYFGSPIKNDPPPPTNLQINIQTNRMTERQANGIPKLYCITLLVEVITDRETDRQKYKQISMLYSITLLEVIKQTYRQRERDRQKYKQTDI